MLSKFNFYTKKKYLLLSKNVFFKVSSTNGLITIAKTLISILTNKVVATIIGTSGIAMVGQLSNFTGIVTLITSGGFNQGLTKYIAEKKEDRNDVLEFVSTAFSITTALSTFVGLIILFASNLISYKIFNTTSYYSIIAVFAFTLLLFNLNTLIMTIVNGFEQYRQYFKINITTNFIGSALTLTLVLLSKEYGALLSIVLFQSIVCVFAYFYVRNEYWIKAFTFRYFKKEKFLHLLKYTYLTLFASLIWPIVAIFVRTYVIKNISPQEAGLWQATRNLNDYIVNIAIGSFSVYLLPKLSSIIDKIELKRELISIYKIIIPVTLIAFLGLFVFRDIVIRILYTNEFAKVGDYLLLQMIGSFFWMCKVPIQNYMLAKGLIKKYISYEISFAILYVLLVFILIPLFQVQGIQMAFAIYNFLYFLLNVLMVNKHLKD
jgi:PST family polysaccharide transporter